MKILSLYVENFGVLHQFSLTPAADLHTMLRPNGWGKSSLAVFVKAMLYGLPVSTRRSLIENERKRYTPWQGGVYGGSMDIQLGDRQLRIERTFGSKESEDTLMLTDLQSGVSIPTETPCLGELWFGIDAAAYERSTYLSQRPTDESDGNLSIHTKLNRLVDAGDDLGSFDRALEILEKQRKYYTVSGGRRGAIADDEEQLMQLTAQIEACHAHLRAALACEDRLTALGAQQADMREQGQRLYECEQQLLRAKETQAKWQTLQQLRAAADGEEKTYAQLLESLGGCLPDAEKLLALEETERQLAALGAQHQGLGQRLEPTHELRREEEALARYFAVGVPDQAEIQQLREQAERDSEAHLQLKSAQAEAAKIAPADAAQPHEEYHEDVRQLQRFFMHYTAKEQKLSHQCQTSKENCRLAEQQLQADTRAVRQSKRILWIASALGLVLTALALVMMPVLCVIPLAAAAVVIAVMLRKQRCAARRCLAAEQVVAAQTEAQAQAAQELAHLQSQWAVACRRLEKQLGVRVQDAAQAQELLADYQTKAAQAQARQAERMAADQARAERLQDLKEQAAAQERALRALWRWGELPDFPTRPMLVERLAQKAARYEQLLQEVRLVKQQLVALEVQLQALQMQRGALLAGCEQAPQTGAPIWMRERMARAEQCLQARQEYLDRAQAYAQENGLTVDMAPPISPTDEQAQTRLSAQRDELQKQEEALYGEIARLRREMEEHTAQGAVLETLESEAAQIRTRLHAAKESLATVQETQKYLKQAKDQLSGRYLAKMKESFSQYLSALSGEEAPSFTMDGNFAVKLRRMGVSRSREAFSTGWRDVIALCARLALVDALFEEEPPFLVLDDPFVNLDDDTAARAKQVLALAAQRYQILYLTCHSSRA